MLRKIFIQHTFLILVSFNFTSYAQDQPEIHQNLSSVQNTLSTENLDEILEPQAFQNISESFNTFELINWQKVSEAFGDDQSLFQTLETQTKQDLQFEHSRSYTTPLVYELYRSLIDEFYAVTTLQLFLSQPNHFDYNSVLQGDWAISSDDWQSQNSVIRKMLGDEADMVDSHYSAFEQPIQDHSLSGKVELFLNVKKPAESNSFHSLFLALSYFDAEDVEDLIGKTTQRFARENKEKFMIDAILNLYDGQYGEKKLVGCNIQIQSFYQTDQSYSISVRDGKVQNLLLENIEILFYVDQLGWMTSTQKVTSNWFLEFKPEFTLLTITFLEDLGGIFPESKISIRLRDDTKYVDLAFQPVYTSIICISYFIVMVYTCYLTQKLRSEPAYASTFSRLTLGLIICQSFINMGLLFSASSGHNLYFAQFIVLYFFYGFTLEPLIFCFAWAFVYQLPGQRTEIAQTKLHRITYLLTFILGFFVIVAFLLVPFCSVLMVNTTAIAVMNSFIWIPQVVKNYRIRSRRGPSPFFILLWSSVQISFQVYLKFVSKNFMQVQTDYTGGMIIIGHILLMVLIISSQKMKGPRWFMPRKYRIRVPQGGHNYLQPVPTLQLEQTRAQLKTSRSEVVLEPENNEDFVCSICLQVISLNINENGEFGPNRQIPKRKLADIVKCLSRSNQGLTQVEQIHDIENGLRGENQDLEQGAERNAQEENERLGQARVELTTEETKIEPHKVQEEQKEKELTDQEVEKLLNKKFMKTPCGHSFHTVCLTKWFLQAHKCPKCRQENLPIPEQEEDLL